MVAEGVVGGRQYPSTISIMVVDDDVTTLNIVSAMLKTWSYDVVTVPNPVEALSILRKGKYSFDLVVTDLHMPQMNGLELQKLVHEEFELPVIMMSADDKESVILKSLEGVLYYIVKPVCKDDMKLVWQCIVQSRKSRSSNVTIEEMLEAGGSGSEFASGQLRQGPSSDQLEDLDCASFNNHDFNHKEDHHHKKAKSTKSSTSNNKKKTRKRDRNTDDDEEDDDSEHNRRLLAKKKAKVVWSNALHNHFLMAIRHIGLDKAVPKRILEFMNVPGLTRENVASHLQKYRMFLKRVAEKARLSKCLSERIFRSSLLSFSLPATPSFNHVQREQYAEYLKQKLQLNDLGLNNSLGTLGTTSASHLGFPMNYNQQQPAAAALNHLASTSSGGHPLYGSGQSHLLMNNTSLHQQQRPMQLGNGMDMFSNYGSSSGFGMPMMHNNVGRTGGYGGAMNNVGNGFMNGGTSWMDTYSPQQSQAKKLQQAINFTFNPFSFGNTSRISSPIIDNLMSTPPLNNANHVGGRASGFNNSVMNFGYNRLTMNNEVVNGLTNGVRNVNLNGAIFNALGNNVSSTAGSFAAPVLPRNSQQQQQNASPLLQGMQQNPFGKGSNDFSFSGLMNNAARTFNSFSMTNDDDDIMVINNLVRQQLDNCQPPPSHQKQSGEDSFSFTSMLSQDENPAPTPMTDAQVERHHNRATSGLVQLSPNSSVNGEVHLQLNPDPFANGQVQLNSNPFVNGQDQQSLNPDANSQLHLNPTANLAPAGNLNLSSSSAANSQLDELNQTGNPNSFGLGSYLMRDDVQSWSQGEKGGGDQQMILNSEVNNNMFQQTDDYSSLFAAQEDDDDFLNALIGFDS